MIAAVLRVLAQITVMRGPPDVLSIGMAVLTPEFMLCQDKVSINLEPQAALVTNEPPLPPVSDINKRMRDGLLNIRETVLVCINQGIHWRRR